MNSLIVITGARGTGKTTLAASYKPPSEVNQIYYHDAENSANHIVEELKKNGLAFGRYVDLNARFSDLPDSDLLSRIGQGKLPWVTETERSTLEGYYSWVINDLAQNLEPDKYSVYIHDPAENFEAGMAAWVQPRRKQTGYSSEAYGKMWTEGVFPLYQNAIAAVHQRGVETVFFITNVRTPWEGKQRIVSKVIPSGKKILYRLSQLFVWLVHEPSNPDGAPAGLVLKERLGQMKVNKETDKWVISRRLPRRIPHCTWDDINRYLEEGCDLANPMPGEIPTPDEEAMMSELLTDAQMRLMVLEAETELAEVKVQGSLLKDENMPTVENPISSMIDPELIVEAERIKLEHPGTDSGLAYILTQKLNISLPKAFKVLGQLPERKE